MHWTHKILNLLLALLYSILKMLSFILFLVEGVTAVQNPTLYLPNPMLYLTRKQPSEFILKITFSRKTPPTGQSVHSAYLIIIFVTLEYQYLSIYHTKSLGYLKAKAFSIQTFILSIQHIIGSTFFFFPKVYQLGAARRYTHNGEYNILKGGSQGRYLQSVQDWSQSLDGLGRDRSEFVNQEVVGIISGLIFRRHDCVELLLRSSASHSKIQA